ncbi:MAG: hypothetical protein P4L53_17695 [Candidatus Obscuribacterales bacterium]|nr:hypothetical protein [Candidatus Obscuribacterales bacterium]
MLDDFDTPLCNKKHYGPVLYLKGDFQVMRCTLCNQIFVDPLLTAAELGEKRKSSRTCISVCDWVTEGKTVRCQSCSYTGPLPTLFDDDDDEG